MQWIVLLCPIPSHLWGHLGMRLWHTYNWRQERLVPRFHVREEGLMTFSQFLACLSWFQLQITLDIICSCNGRIFQTWWHSFLCVCVCVCVCVNYLVSSSQLTNEAQVLNVTRSSPLWWDLGMRPGRPWNEDKAHTSTTGDREGRGQGTHIYHWRQGGPGTKHTHLPLEAVYIQHTVQLLKDFHHCFLHRNIDVFPVHSEMIAWLILHTRNLNRYSWPLNLVLLGSGAKMIFRFPKITPCCVNIDTIFPKYIGQTKHWSSNQSAVPSCTIPGT